MKRQNLRTVALIVVTFTYLLIGAAIFGYLESDHEVKQREALELIESMVKRRYNISEDDYVVLTTAIIKSVPHKAGIQWKFPGAFYFATTVVTTIGYGHSTPATMAGRSFCMIYALIGIPLGLVMFQSIGERLNTFVGWALKCAKRLLKSKKQEVTQTNLVMVVSVLSTILMTSMAAVFAKYERWEYFDALYYCFITLTTIGFGDYVALQKESALQSKPEYVALSLIFILFGLSVVSSAVNLLVLKFLTLNTEDERRDEQLRYTANLNSIQLDGDVITPAAKSVAARASLARARNKAAEASDGGEEAELGAQERASREQLPLGHYCHLHAPASALPALQMNPSASARMSDRARARAGGCSGSPRQACRQSSPDRQEADRAGCAARELWEERYQPLAESPECQHRFCHERHHYNLRRANLEQPAGSESPSQSSQASELFLERSPTKLQLPAGGSPRTPLNQFFSDSNSPAGCLHRRPLGRPQQSLPSPSPTPSPSPSLRLRPSQWPASGSSRRHLRRLRSSPQTSAAGQPGNLSLESSCSCSWLSVPPPPAVFRAQERPPLQSACLCSRCLLLNADLQARLHGHPEASNQSDKSRKLAARRGEATSALLLAESNQTDASLLRLQQQRQLLAPNPPTSPIRRSSSSSSNSDKSLPNQPSHKLARAKRRGQSSDALSPNLQKSVPTLVCKCCCSHSECIQQALSDSIRRKRTSQGESEEREAEDEEELLERRLRRRSSSSPSSANDQQLAGQTGDQDSLAGRQCRPGIFSIEVDKSSESRKLPLDGHS